MTLQVIPEALGIAAARMEALAVRLAAVRASCAPVLTVVVPAAADPVSLLTASALTQLGAVRDVHAGQGIEELARAGLEVGDSAASYAAEDARAAQGYRWSGG